MAAPSDDDSLDGPERDARSILRGLGFDANKVTTTSEKSADFRVEGDDPPYLVEVKSRLLDGRLSLTAPGLSEPLNKSMRHDAKVGQWLSESRQQFKALDPDHERLWFLWCAMEASFGSINQVERTISVLYGVQEALNVMPPHQSILVFYATPGAFARFPDVDGAVIFWPEGSGITLCPNEASPRFNLVMRSKLLRTMRDAGVASVLPSERAETMQGYVIPPEVRGTDEVLRHLQGVKGLPYLNFQAMDFEYQQTMLIGFGPGEAQGATSVVTGTVGSSSESVRDPGDDYSDGIK